MSNRRSRRRMRKAQQDQLRAGGKLVQSFQPPNPSPQTATNLASTGNPPPLPLDQTTEYFGPLQPPPPQAPQSVEGRRFDFPSGYNISQYPRAYEPISFQELRALATGYDLMAVAIQTRKDQLCQLPWSIGPRDPTVDVEKSPALKARILKLEKMFRRPDTKMFWSRWLSAVVDDLLVLDAPAVYVRRTRGGDPLSFHHVDGSTIKVVLDERGNTPDAPWAAYQQILKGYPARNYSTDQMVYLPKNLRTWKVYGFGPVEQVIMTVNIALRRQLWQLAYFTDGNVPDSLIGVPSTWTPDQIRQFQDWFDSILAGNSQRRRGATFVPGEVAKSYVPTKEAEIFGAAEEWIGRVVCWAFGLSHQALVKEVNRATADTAREMELQEGLGPYMQWAKEFVDLILLDHLGVDDLEFKWVNDKEVDAAIQAQVLTGYAKEGILTRNQARAELGQDPDPSPEADLLMIDTPNGPIPLSSDEQIKLKQKNVSAFTGMGLSPDGSVPKAPEPGPEDGGGGESGGGGGKQPRPRPKGSGEAAPGGEGGGGAAGKVATPSPAHHVHKRADDHPKTSPLRTHGRRLQRSMSASVAKVFAKAERSVADQVEMLLHLRGVKKVDGNGSGDADHGMTAEEIAALAQQVVAQIDLGDLEEVRDVTEADLESMALDSAKVAMAMIGVTDQAKLVDVVNQRAVQYARDRAAELVGKRVLADGTIIDNPEAKWAITESTRDGLRDMITRSLGDNLGSTAIVKSLEDSFLFSPERADMVSRTEIAKANSEAAMVAYREAQGIGIAVSKTWILGPNPCPICEDNADDGEIDLDDSFSSGDDSPPAHPNCECAVVPVTSEGAEA